MVFFVILFAFGFGMFVDYLLERMFHRETYDELATQKKIIKMLEKQTRNYQEYTEMLELRIAELESEGVAHDA